MFGWYTNLSRMRQRLGALVFITICFLISHVQFPHVLYPSSYAMSRTGGTLPKLVIITTESRQLYVPEDINVPIPVWTLAAL